ARGGSSRVDGAAGRGAHRLAGRRAVGAHRGRPERRDRGSARADDLGGAGQAGGPERRERADGAARDEGGPPQDQRGADGGAEADLGAGGGGGHGGGEPSEAGVRGPGDRVVPPPAGERGGGAAQRGTGAERWRGA